MKTDNAILQYLLVIAFCFAAMLAYVLPSKNIEQHEEQRRATAPQNAEHEEEFVVRCTRLSEPTRSDCLADAKEAYREDEERHYDLRAQQDMAIYALVVVLVSIAGLGISGVGVWLLLRTLNEQQAQFAAERRPWIHFRNIRVEAISLDRAIPELHTKGTRSIRVRIAYECVHSGDTPALNFKSGAAADTSPITEDSYPIKTIRRHHAHSVERRSGHLFAVGDTDRQTIELIANFEAPTNKAAWATVKFYFSLIATYRGTVPGLGTLETIQSFALHQLHPGGETRFALNYWDLVGPPPAQPPTFQVDPWGYSSAK